MKTLSNKTRLAGMITAVSLAGFLSTHVTAGPSPDLMNSVLQSREQAAKVPQGETVAMVCAKCQSVVLSNMRTEKGFLAWFHPKAKHECPGCGGELSMRDVPAGQGGRLSVSDYVHTCSKCGDESAFCCTTKQGAGPTKGMEKK